MPGDLSEAGAQAPLFGFQALRQRLGLGGRIVAEEGYDWPELGRHGPGFALLPAANGFSRNARTFAYGPLQETQFSTPLP